MKFTLKFGAAAALALALSATPRPLLAQSAISTNKPAAATQTTAQDEQTPKAKKPSPGPFHGKLLAVDPVAKTIRVGKRTFQINGQTRISKNGKPATLADGLVGEEVSGYVKPTETGQFVATVVTFGPKLGKNAQKKSSTQEK
jgi:hypothetical protein